MRPSSLYFDCTFAVFNGWRWNNYVKPLLIFWGIRNLCRYFILFFGVILFFTLDDVEKVIRFILHHKYLMRLLVYISILSLGFLAMILVEEFFGAVVA